MKYVRKKKRIVGILTVLMMVLTLMPQMVFADTDASLKLTLRTVAVGAVSSTSRCYVTYSGVDPENIAIKSSDENIVPTKYIELNIVPSMNRVTIKYAAIAPGNVTITAYDKTNEDLSSSVTVTISEAVSNTTTVYIVENGTRNCSRSLPYPVEFKIEDESIAKVDENGLVTGVSPGETNLCITGGALGDYEIVDKIIVKEDPTGIYYNNEKVTELDWDVKEQNSDHINITAKFLTQGTSESNSTTSLWYYDSTNVDVAEPVYSGASAANHSGTGEIALKKNGTATIYVYKFVNRIDYLAGTLKLNVTGFDETSDPDEGWVDLTEAQGMMGKIQLLDYPQQTQSFNEAMYDNRITQYMKSSDAVTFTFEFAKSSGNQPEYSEDIMTTWKENVLKYVNIYEVNEDGSLGEIVASNGNGYTLLSGPYANPYDAPLQIKVDNKEKILKKGTTYALVIDGRVSPVTGSNGELASTGYLTLPVICKFTTSPAASSVTVDPAEAAINAGESLTLTATMDEGSKVDPDDIIIWTSEDESIASVDNEGKVTANATGRTVITATALDGKVSDSCTVTVPGILLKDPADTQIELTEGDTYKLEADFYSADAEQKIEWSSSDESVATVDADGIITAVGEGEAVITGTAGEYTVESTVTVNAAPAGYEPVNNTDPSGDGEDPSGDGNAAEAENGQENDGSAKTGDDMNIWMLIALLGASGAAGAAALRRRAKQ